MYRITRRHLTALGIAALATITLSACGTNDNGTPPAAGATSTSANGVPVEHNDADVAFINEMTPHHTGAVEMSSLALSRAQDPRVKALATQIKAAQQPEIDQMAQMAAAWGVRAPSTTEMSGHSSDGMSGTSMTSAAMLNELERLQGKAFDKRFLELMVIHHEGALKMAQTELANGTSPTAKGMAQSIVTAQTAEISQMKDLLANL